MAVRHSLRWVCVCVFLFVVGMASADAVSPFTVGPFSIQQTKIRKGQLQSPVSAILFAPKGTQTYPTIVFQHGFMSLTSYYTDMFERIASHGFIVAAGQMYNPFGLLSFPTVAEETQLGAQFLDWVGTNVENVTKTQTDTNRMIISGHSRGGQVAFRLMNEYAQGKSYQLISVAGVDPVTGEGRQMSTASRYTNTPFTFTNPATIIQCMVGSNSSSSCAPKDFNGPQFYSACVGPTLWSRIPQAGHGDMMNAGPARLSGMLCTSGGKYKQTLETVAGLMVTFGQETFNGQTIAHPKAGAPMAVTYEEKNI